MFKEDKSRTAEMLDEDNHQYLYILTRPRTAPTYEYEGAMMSNMGGTGPIELDIGRPIYCVGEIIDRKTIS